MRNINPNDLEIYDEIQIEDARKQKSKSKKQYPYFRDKYKPYKNGKSFEYFKRYCSRCGKLFQRESKFQKVCDKCNKMLNGERDKTAAARRRNGK